MKTNTRLPIALAAVAVAVITYSGCTTTPVLRPPTAKLRDNLGRVAVVALTDSPRIRYQVPGSKADIAAEKQSFELVTPRMVVGNARGLGGGPGAAIVGAVALTAPLVVMGGAPFA